MKSILFADDTVLAQSDNNLGKLQNSVNFENLGKLQNSVNFDLQVPWCNCT